MTQSYQDGNIAKAKKDNPPVKNAKGKNTRPLNSFMAFRCYYAVLFDEFEQKIISTYVVFLWQHDLCKAKWALAAKAYSVIRDQVGKEHAPLDAFLMLVAELLGLIEPQHYLAVMGWEISVNEAGIVSLVKTDKMEIDDNMLRTNISVEDIVAYACQHGYAGAMGSIAVVPNDKSIMAMAASAQLLPGKNVEKNGQDDQQKTQRVATLQGVNGNATIHDSTGSGGFSGAGNTTNAANDYLTAVSPFSPSFDHFANLNAASNSLIQHITTSSPQVNAAANPMPLTLATNAADSTDQFMMDDILDWDPDTDLPVYDPADGDKWDAFDISAWVHPDAYIN
ncbi:MAG: hypothetical protein Q9225_001232 [Loekoesia sp. 1 TL-2023]